MSTFLEDYKTYYRLRMQRYENNPDYPESYKSEKAIYDVIASCATLEEFKNKLGDLNEKNAIALVIDQYNLRLRHYVEMNEPIKASSCKLVIDSAASMKNVTELITMVNEEANKLNLAVTADTIMPFNDPGSLERIAIWEQADVPEKYKPNYRKYAEEEKRNLQKQYRDTENNMSNWLPGWKFDFSRILEGRHRRLIPFPDETIKKYIQQTKAILDAG